MITDGPNKPTLQKALTIPDAITAHFHIDGEGVDVSISRMEEQADGFSFELEGRIASGVMKGAKYRAMYHIEGRHGSMVVMTTR
jgi:hypothetical protein